MMNKEILTVLEKIAQSLAGIESQLTEKTAQPGVDFDRTLAFSWRKTKDDAQLIHIQNPNLIDLDDLIGVERQKKVLIDNTAQFISGTPANHALLWGAKGTGKSSIIKGLLQRYAPQGLRVIEVDRKDLVDIPDISNQLQQSDKKFILFCDDLSFEATDVSYKALKVALDGGMHAIPKNVMIYATSNRRHLLPETMSENQQVKIIDAEVHYGDALEEKLSLSERFGLWLSFHPFNDKLYFSIVKHWMEKLDLEFNESIAADALKWSRQRASKSGRCAYQFAVNCIGKQ